MTPLCIVLFGGSMDGSIIVPDKPKEVFKINENTYRDAYLTDNKGRSIYYCCGGGGKMKREWVERLFK